MLQKSIELILLRQLASYLATAVFIVDPDGNLIYCNEPAERILGFRFSETGEMSAEEWATVFVPQDKEGKLLEIEKLPLYASYTEHRAAQARFYIRNLQNVVKHIEVFTLPIVNELDNFYGAVAFFQELPP